MSRGSPAELGSATPSNMDPEDEMGRLVAEGLATPGVGNLSDLPPPLRLPTGRPLPSEALAELRADEG